MGPGSLVKPAPEIIIGVFYLPPAWLFTFCFMGAAIFLEFAHYWNTIIKGTIAGLLSGLIYYITASSFIDMPGYGVNEKIIAVVSCALGGFIASVLMMTFGKARLQKQMNPAEN
jgi:thiamine transporter ThiT